MVTVRLNPSVDAVLAGQLVDLWTRVVNAGGTVGLAPPVTPDDVQPLAQRAFSRAAAGLADLAVAFDDDPRSGRRGVGRPLGMGLLDQVEGPLDRHLGIVRRLMRDPDFSGRSIGVALLAALETAAARRGIGRLVVEVRSGRGREPWYEAQGFSVDASLPDRVRVHGDPVEVVHMSKSLDGKGSVTGQGVTGQGVTGQGVMGQGVTGQGVTDAHGARGRAPLRLPLRRLDPGLPLPRYATPGDAGLDMYARVDVELEPGARAVVPTGVAVAVPAGYVGLVHPRSGLAARHGVGVVNGPGTIDSGYRGEIQVVLVNLDPAATVRLARGDRIAQLVVQAVESVEVDVVDELPAGARGEGGFGSTGR